MKMTLQDTPEYNVGGWYCVIFD